MKNVSFPHLVKTFSHILCIWWLLKLTLKISRKFNIGIPWETSQILKGLFAKMCENSSQWIFVKLQSWTCIFSLGLDNAFVILNSWHRSDKKASVEDRLGDTMAEAGVSSAWYYDIILGHNYSEDTAEGGQARLNISLPNQDLLFRSCIILDLDELFYPSVVFLG